MSVSIINKYFPELNKQQIEQFGQLQALYSYWNERINVISRKDIDELYERHVLHSLAIAKKFNFPAQCKILDVGTGGGFPGIPLAIMFPEAQFTLVDSIGKKITVVKEVANALQLKNVQAFHERAENLKENYHFVVNRAVTDFSQFVPWVIKKIEKQKVGYTANGIISLKGGDLTEELKNFKNIQIYNISDWFNEKFFETKKVIYYPKI